MKINANDRGLFEFNVDILGEKKKKVLKGLVDTGSTDCACDYHVITTLQARPVSFDKISTIDSSKRVFGYKVTIGFDKSNDDIVIYRVTDLPKDIHFILGMSFLSKCNLIFKDSYLIIDWKK